MWRARHRQSAPWVRIKVEASIWRGELSLLITTVPLFSDGVTLRISGGWSVSSFCSLEIRLLVKNVYWMLWTGTPSQLACCPRRGSLPGCGTVSSEVQTLSQTWKAKKKCSEALDFSPSVLLLWEGVRHCDGDTGQVEGRDQHCFKTLIDDLNQNDNVIDPLHK